MSTKTWIIRMAAMGAIGAAAVVLPPSGAPSPAVYAAPGLGAGGEYHPLAPARILDTRTGINDPAPFGAKPTSNSGASFNVDILGQGGVPAEVGGVNRDVLAVVANVTVVGSTAAGYLSMSPTGSNAGESSLVNFGPVEAVPNLAVIGVGTGGLSTITIVTPNANATAHVLIDVFGWISKTDFPDTADTGARFVPVGPTRVLDTRSVPVPAGWPSGRSMGTMEQLMLPIRGANGLVPNTANVTGVMVNITAANNLPGSVPTFLAATPAATPPGVEPATSVTNLNAGQVKANMAIVPVGDDGNIRLFNRSGSTHLIVDVLGYLERGAPENTRAGRVVPLDAPFRVLDTRQPAFGSVPLGAGTKEDWSFKSFADSVILGGVPVGAQSALIGNFTGTGLTPLFAGQPVTSFMTVYPGNGAPPNSSNINLTAGTSVPNTSLLRYGTVGADPNSIAVYNFDGQVHYLLDVYAVVLAD